jgi:hypothetical protein
VTAEEDDLNERIDEGMTTFTQTKKDDLAYSQSTKFYDKSLLPSTVIQKDSSRESVDFDLTKGKSLGKKVQF